MTKKRKSKIKKDALRQEAAEAKEEKNAINEINNLLETFYDVSDVLTLGPSLEQVLREMFVRISKRAKVFGANLWLLDGKKEFFNLAAAYGLPEPFVELCKKSPLQNAEGVPGAVLRTKKPYLMKDPHGDPAAPKRFIDLMGEKGFDIKSVFATPLIVNGEAIGSLNFFLSEQKESLSRAEYVLFYSIGNQIASFIQNSKIAEELKKRVEELEKFQKVMVGRELEMINLKKEITRLKEQSSR